MEALRDKHGKFAAYEQAGVPEYWLVNPKTRSVVVYRFDSTTSEYGEVGQWSAAETARSELLDGFEVIVGDLFPSND